ncbi:hypothetical protein K8O93_00710 [Gordonia bronchialis]|uniref:hypothetical protein n=1 Tax=Gordonia bronchialis TaxID=2054 RepID=UPI001CC0EA56|nr:hypothetical protein [Gordonia bronchialis]UAK38354.1 hypothetical protein K8O93_00710 [Gordonia bronchialis]
MNPFSTGEFESAEQVDTRERVLTRFTAQLTEGKAFWLRIPDELEREHPLLDFTRDNRGFFLWDDPGGRGTVRVFVDLKIDIYGRRWIKFVEAIPL